jgi:methylphosphotriester-DNA--protein-cysteine methyltransferase
MKNARRFAALGCLIVAAFWGVVWAAGPLRGNTKSRVFHQESCRYYTCTNCTAKFATAREAVDSGYRPCGVCEPGSGGRETARASGAAFVGNTSSHKFHRNSCRYAGCANCTAKFRSRDEAIDAGFAPGGCCKP